MIQLRTVAALLLVLSLGAIGCGGAKGTPKDGGSGGGTGTGGGTTGTGGGNTGTGGGGTGGGSTGTGGGPTGGEVLESEAAGTHTNDTAAGAELIVSGTVVKGSIGAASATDAGTVVDTDAYKFTAVEGDVFRITLQGQQGSTFQPAVIVVNEDDTYYRDAVIVGAAATDPLSRQVFIPATGTYYVVVDDVRNLASDNSGMAGGADVTYALTLKKETLTPSAVTLPVVDQAGTFGTDGTLAAFGFNNVEGNIVTGSIVAANLSTPSDVDPAIYLVDNSGSVPKVVAGLEDIDSVDVDAALTRATTSGGAYYFVADYSVIKGPARNYTVSFSSAVPGPGNSCGTVTALTGAGMVTNDTSTNANAFDVTQNGVPVCVDVFNDGAEAYNLPAPDYVYSISVPAGQTLTATVMPSGNWDSAVAIVTNCASASMSCVAAGDQGLEAAADNASYTNSGAQPVTVFIIVDGWDTDQKGSFTLTTTLQ